MPRRRVHHLAAATAAATTSLTTVLAVLGAAPPAHATGRLHVVLPGESIQRAVDSALPGDTVQLLPGTYLGSVRITTSGLTLRGAGPSSVITPGDAALGTAGDPACAAAGHGLCIFGTDQNPLRGITIEALAVTGFRKNGMTASSTDGMAVRATYVHDNGQQGISQERSTRAVIVGNESTGNGQSGIFLANVVDSKGNGAVDTGGTVVSGNRLTGNRIGVAVRRLRNLSVEQNDIQGNCGGVFVVGDETVPRAGSLSVTRNRVIANNQYCVPYAGLSHMQGTGILLTGADDVSVTQNEVRDNVGDSPMSGGIVFFHSLVGVANTRNTVGGNHASGNSPADLVDNEGDSSNSFTLNHCSVSEPAGRC
ncbi:right-handed parallel beta-helix repeat-containing protein [Kitasatospora sp. DSM 101779]|uniref:right-handed parallel beta-helix repeat-containing protein n=1 Tax=Kitasatospora sp. DSM 101779 TaxID=2853165 RepID=UPI0021D8014A|nr:right-handed parallel beta-helix repeat-containing protein [Kitasatospora sp. DSM 101779]MCU7827060.1 right-handed parallel beta-helix repeat-containing protein [Kitasatospora sp. DSM 101779]